jgi:hypothetical protein
MEFFKYLLSEETSVGELFLAMLGGGHGTLGELPLDSHPAAPRSLCGQPGGMRENS